MGTARRLTRVALPEGSLVVNSSQGGGSKDTWVLASRASVAERELAGAELVSELPQAAEVEQGPEVATAGCSSIMCSNSSSNRAGGADAGPKRRIAVLDRSLRRTCR